jgi:hypothetical protein
MRYGQLTNPLACGVFRAIPLHALHQLNFHNAAPSVAGPVGGRRGEISAR